MNADQRRSRAAGEVTQDVEANRKSSLLIRWIMLALSCMVMYGLYYLIIMPASVYRQLRETMPEESFEARYQSLYIAATVPAMVLPVFAGTLVDMIQVRICVLLLSTVCLLGQVVTSIGAEREEWAFMLLGRFIYGLGMEPLFVANQAFLTTWFSGKELGVALGISGAVSYIGFIASQILGPVAANGLGTAFSFWVGAMMMATSAVMALVIFVIDHRVDRRPIHVVSNTSRANSSLVDTANQRENLEEERSNTCTCSQHQANNPLQCSDLRKFRCSFWLLCCSSLLVYSIGKSFTGISSGLILERNLFRISEGCALSYRNKCSSGYLEPEGGNEATDGAGRVCPGTSYAPVLPESLNVTSSDPSWSRSEYIFESLEASDVDCSDTFWSEACAKDYCDKQGEATQKAGILMAIPYIVTVATTSLFGHFGVDKRGWRAEMVAVASTCQIIAHTILSFEGGSLIMPLILQGIGYSMAISALWPSVPFVVSNDAVGKAFGVMTCIQNVGLSVSPLIIAAIHNRSNGRYIPGAENFFIGCSSLEFVVGIALILIDRRDGGKLRAVTGTHHGIESDSEVFRSLEEQQSCQQVEKAACTEEESLC